MWSVGCTLFELATGKILFPGRSNNGMLRVMMDLLGKFPKKMLRKGQFTNVHFDHSFNFLQQDIDKISQKSIVRTISITKPTNTLKARLGIPTGSAEDLEDHAAFLDLLEKCLNLDPVRRISVTDALMHPFITGWRN
jgi:serine/threonine-protein kinase PRP4